MNRVIRGVGALVVLFALLVGGPIVLALAWGDPWPAGGWGEVQLVGMATVVGAVVVVGWLAWALTLVCVLVETIAVMTGKAARRIPFALPGQQDFARALVVSVAALGLGASVTATAGGAVVYSATSAEAHADTGSEGAINGRAITTHSPTTCWKVAETSLGDGARWKEVLDLNRGIEFPDGSTFTSGTQTIPAGTTLQLPVGADESPDAGHEPSIQPTQRIVERGENLWTISDEEYDEPTRYEEIFDASTDTIQPDGLRLTDPDHIRPGWILTIPHNDPPEPPPVESELEPERERTSEPPRAVVEGPPAPAEQSADASPAADDVTEAGSEGWLVAGLTGAGAVLGGALLLAFRAGVLTRLRHRRPGQVKAPMPENLRRVEKTLTYASGDTARRVAQLDRLLRTLPDAGAERPQLTALMLDDSLATLHLAEPAWLPSPWSGDGKIWTSDLDATSDATAEPPYPMLVSLGADDDGRVWFVDLEARRQVDIAGDSDRVSDLGRHVCAELALNPWSTLVRVEAVGLGDELAGLDPLRLRARAADDLDGGATIRATVTDSNRETGRVTITFNDSAASADITIDDDGLLRVESLPLNVMAAGLSADDAAVSSAIAEVSRDAEMISGDDEHSELTEPRSDEPAGARSLLPASAERYEDCAATTREDVAVIAPLAAPGASQAVEVSDPDLDADVAAWFSSESATPRLTLLGAVSATAGGAYRQIAERKAYFIEMLAYLALHPEGVPAAAVAEAFSISASRARTDIGFIRSWLGDDPRTGHPHLPAANASRAFQETGLSMYQLDGVLTDVDLFRRLRTRARARGEAGMKDLETALRLVHGEPFSRLRERGWSWLLDGERLHETITFAIVDTAHVVVTDALERGDLDRAQQAADAACLAAPYDEVARLDRIKVAQAAGHHELAERMIREDITDRTDDHLPPVDLPERTKAILARANRVKAHPTS